jgi:cell wall-associated NlpC family hydrolase
VVEVGADDQCIWDGRGAGIWNAAAGLIGVRFRLHGRDVASGLDCVGLVVLAMARAGVELRCVPDRYALRGGDATAMADWIAQAGLCRVAKWQTGDMLFCDMGGGQHHVMIGGRGKADGAGATIHAHAGLRRVVMSPGAPGGTVLSAWRA